MNIFIVHDELNDKTLGYFSNLKNAMLFCKPDYNQMDMQSAKMNIKKKDKYLVWKSRNKSLFEIERRKLDEELGE